MKGTTLRLLAHAKEFYVSGERELEQDSNLACMQAVLKLHDAVEYCVRAVIEEFMVNHDRNADLMQLIKCIDQATQVGKKMPPSSQIDLLNATRAKVKHHGSVPSSEDTQRCHMHAKEFLEQVSREFLGVEFRSVSRLLLIEDESVRQHIEMAESKCKEGDHLESLVAAKKAFYVARPADRAFVRKEGFFSSFFLARELQSDKKLHKALEAIIDKVNQLEEDVALLMMGVDILKYQRFEAITPRISFFSNGGCSILVDDSLTPTEELAREAIAYVTDITLLWQRRGVVNHHPDRFEGRLRQRRPWKELRKETGIDPTKGSSDAGGPGG